jgi:hypothetical protein
MLDPQVDLILLLLVTSCILNTKAVSDLRMYLSFLKKLCVCVCVCVPALLEKKPFLCINHFIWRNMAYATASMEVTEIWFVVLFCDTGVHTWGLKLCRQAV